jgi:hypothetical protein
MTMNNRFWSYLVEVEFELEGSATSTTTEGVAVEAMERVSVTTVPLLFSIQGILTSVKLLTHL